MCGRQSCSFGEGGRGGLYDRVHESKDEQAVRKQTVVICRHRLLRWWKSETGKAQQEERPQANSWLVRECVEGKLRENVHATCPLRDQAKGGTLPEITCCSAASTSLPCSPCSLDGLLSEHVFNKSRDQTSSAQGLLLKSSRWRVPCKCALW